MARLIRNIDYLRASYRVRLKKRQQNASAAVNWEAIHQALASAEARLNNAEETSPEALEQIWERRAAAVAHENVEEEQGEQIELALVRLGRETYGLEVQYVFDIRPLEAVTGVPRTPEWVAGVVNLRGRVLSVLDLRRYLGLPRAETRPAGAEEDRPTGILVVVETPDMELALLVDAVLSIESLPASQIQDVSAEGIRPQGGIRAEYVRGVFLSAAHGLRSQNGRSQAGENGSRLQNRRSELGADSRLPQNGRGNGSLPMAGQNGAAPGDAGMIIILDLQALLAEKQLIVHEEIV